MNIKIKIYVTCGVFLGLLAVPLTAWAVDFTFNVPVNIQNQEMGINNGEVRCSVYSGQPLSNTNRIGEGMQFFALDNQGSFQGTVTVAFYADQEDAPEDARFYTCVLRLQEINGTIIESSVPGAVGNYTVQGNF